MLYRCHIRPYSRKNSGSGNRLHIDSMQHVITYLEVLSMGILWTYQVLYGEIFYSQPPIARTNPGLGTQHHSHIISTCNWGHFTKILDLKNTIQTPPINYSSQFQNKFWHWVEILSCQSWVSKGLWLRFSIWQSSTTNILPNNHHNHRMHVIRHLRNSTWDFAVALGKTKSSPRKIKWLEDDFVFLGWPIFRGDLSFRGDSFKSDWQIQIRPDIATHSYIS